MLRDGFAETAERAKKIVKSPLMRRAMLCATLLLAPACSPKTQSWMNNSEIQIDKVPDDICKVNGEPKIINVSTESDGDLNFVYVRNNGDIVSLHYTVTAASLGTKYGRQGDFVFKGGYCPPSTE